MSKDGKLPLDEKLSLAVWQPHPLSEQVKQALIPGCTTMGAFLPFPGFLLDFGCLFHSSKKGHEAMFDLIKNAFSSDISRYILVSAAIIVIFCALSQKKKISARSIALMGIMVSLHIIFVRFLSIQTWNIKISFGFLPLVITAILLGPVEAGIVGAMADFIGAIIFPVGAYFPGMTLTALITGIVWGLFLYKKVSLPRIIFAAAINNFMFSMLLNGYWISMLYGSPFAGILQVRVPQACLMFMAEIVIISVLQEVLFKRIKVIFDNPAIS